MYTVECVNGNSTVIMFDDTSLVDDTQLINPKLDIGNGSAGSFSALLPPINRAYNYCNKVVSTIKVKKDGVVIWTGRPMTDSVDFHNRKNINCEGAMAYLNDTILPPKKYSGSTPYTFINAVLNDHNKQVAANRKIYAGVINSGTLNETTIASNYDTTWDFIKKNFVDVLGGYTRVRETNGTLYFDYYSSPPKQAVQTIDFGSNLLDYVKEWDYSNICTVCIPRGKQLDSDGTGETKYLTVASVNNNSIYVANTALLNKYGRFERTVDFSDDENAKDLLTHAKAYMAAQAFETMSMTVKAVDLHMLTSTTPSFDLFDNVRCFSIPHGLDAYFPITEMSLPLDSPENVEYTLGNSQSTSMTGSVSSGFSNANSMFNELPTRDSLLEEAFRNSNEILTQKTTGYVNITHTSDYSEALIISASKPWNTSSSYWKFDMNGLGYFKQNNNGTYTNTGIALTRDGQINANMITTGQMNAARIVSGSITVTQLGNGCVSNAKLADGSVNTVKIANSSITAAKMPDKVITNVKIADGAITARTIAANSIAANHIAAGTITGDKIAGSTIEGKNIKGGTITADKLTAGTITADRIKAGTITADNLGGGCVTNSKLGDSSVTNSKIGNNEVSNSKISDLSADKLTAGTIDARYINVTNLNASNITSGTISADRISGGTIDANITMSRTLKLEGSLSFGSYSYIYGNYSAMYINASTIYLGGDTKVTGSSFSVDGYYGSTASFDYISSIVNNSDGTITWSTSTITTHGGIITGY